MMVPKNESLDIRYIHVQRHESHRGSEPTGHILAYRALFEFRSAQSAAASRCRSETRIWRTGFEQSGQHSRLKQAKGILSVAVQHSYPVPSSDSRVRL